MTKTKKKRSQPIGPLGVGNLPTSLLFIFPLFLAYEIGVMFSTSSMNGVDFVTRWIYRALGSDLQRYLLVHAGLAVIYVGYLLYVRRRRSFSLRSWPPVFIEATIYALTLGTAINLLMQKVLGLAMAPIGENVVIALGAGVHEELVFRLFLMGGGTALLIKLGVHRWAAFALALIISAALFSAAHHIGPSGDAWATGVFTYRVLAGVAFGLIFYFRSLAHAVYAHALYDIYVFWLQS